MLACKMNKKITFFYLLLILILSGCSIPKNPSFANGEIIVPKQFRGGRGWRSHPSDYERYLSSYRRAYWRAIEDFVKDPDYLSSKSDYIASGWGSEVSGYQAGYIDAEKDIKKNIKYFGKEKTHEFAKQLWEGY